MVKSKNIINKGSVTTSIPSLPEQTKYNYYLNRILDERLFESGSELKALLVKKFNVKEDYARKIVSRAAASKIIKSSKPFTFGNRQFIYLLPDQDIDTFKIKKICAKSRPPIYRLLLAMERNGGIISYYEALKLTASPDEESSTRVSTLKDILKVLSKLDIVYEKGDFNSVNYILLKDKFQELGSTEEKKLMEYQFAKMVLDCSLIPDIVRWMIKCNLIDNIKYIYRNKKTPSIGAKHNGLMWDAFSYTKTTGINAVKGVNADTIEKQTLVVIDIIVSEEYTQIDLDGFYSRVQININSVKKGNRKVMPIIIYKECNDEILNKIKRLGFLAFDVGSIFGSKIYSILKKLNEINQQLLLEEDIDKNVNKLLKSIRSAGQEDALKDLRGVLFEVLLLPLLKSFYGTAGIDRGRILKKTHDDGSKEEYEYDYIFHSTHPPETVVVELKGYSSSATISLGDIDKKSSLKWFFDRTVPFAKKFFKNEISEGKILKAVYITSASFWDDGREFVTKLNKTKLKSSKLNVAYERNDLLQLLEVTGFKKEANIIEKYYTKREK